MSITEIYTCFVFADPLWQDWPSLLARLITWCAWFDQLHPSLSPQPCRDVHCRDGTCHRNPLHVFPCYVFRLDLVCILQNAHWLWILSSNHDSVRHESRVKLPICHQLHCCWRGGTCNSTDTNALDDSKKRKAAAWRHHAPLTLSFLTK